jgi:Tfp pilus assembly protein PilW
MRTERGFILPMTLISLTLFMLIVVHQATMYITEKRFYKESEEMFELDSLMQQAFDDMKKMLQEEGVTGRTEYTKEFKNGTAHVQIEQIDGLFHVRIECRTVTERKYVVRCIYDREADAITYWSE